MVVDSYYYPAAVVAAADMDGSKNKIYILIVRLFAHLQGSTITVPKSRASKATATIIFEYMMFGELRCQ